MSTLLLSENFPPKVGGSGRWFWELYRRLPREDYFIVAGGDAGEAAFDAQHDLRLERIPLSFSTRLPRLRSLREYWQAYSGLRRIAVREKATIVHAGRWLPEGLLSWWLHRRKGIPYLCYAHGEEVNPFLEGEPQQRGRSPAVYGSRELGLIAGVVLRGARAVVANSENTQSLLVDGWGLDAGRVACLHPGVDVDRFRPGSDLKGIRQRLGWQDRLVVLTVGRLQERKGQSTMIEAIPRLAARYPSLLFVVVGDGEEYSRLVERAAALEVTDHVEFRRDVDDQALVDCYQGCDLFILPNRAVGADIEGFGMVLLEAQACGKAVVAGRSGGTREAMVDGRTGLLVDCSTAPSLVAGIEGLLGDPIQRSQMGEVGRDWVAKSFGWEALSRTAGELFSNL